MKNILFATSGNSSVYQNRRTGRCSRRFYRNISTRDISIFVLILPKYACMKQEWKDKMEYVTHFYMDLGYKNCYVGIMHMSI